MMPNSISGESEIKIGSQAPSTNESITPSNSNASASNPTNPRVVDSEPVQDDTLPEDHSDAFLENTNQLP